MKTIVHFISLFVLIWNASGAEKPWSAKVLPLPKQLDGYGLPPNLIEVGFPEGGFPLEEVRQTSHYSLSLPSRSIYNVPLKAAKPKGGVGGEGEEATHAESVLLVPVEEIDPAAPYILEVTFNNRSSGPIKVQPSKENPKKESDSEIQRIVDLFSAKAAQNLVLNLEGLGGLNADKTAIFTYKVDYSFGGSWKASKDGSWFAGSYGKFNLASEGMLELKDTPSVPDHLEFSGSYEYMWMWLLDNPLTEKGDLMYFLGFRLKGFEFESDQDFDTVNYTAKPQLAAWIPYSNIPALWWSRQVRISGNAATPAFVFFGYTKVQSIASDPARVDTERQESDRLEGEIAYAFPLTSSLRLGFRGRLFWLFENGGTANYKEAFVQYYLTESKTTSVIFRYIKGEVPPTFEKGDTASAGFSVSF